jgi:YVTN family beta-propeller protein
LAVTPDGRKVYIALDDVNEIVEADTATRTILRRMRIEGGPFGLAINRNGTRLFVTCRDSDKVIALDTQTMKIVDGVPVGSAPVSVAFVATRAGARLVVANSLSDDASVLEAEPLKELARPQTGREPYAVAAAPDGSLAFVACRLAVPVHVLAVPDSELTLIDPAGGRLIKRASYYSAHLAEGIATVPGRQWSLTPIIKVRNLVPITQVANGWVMSSGLAISDYQGNILQIPLDEANDYFADPSGIVVDAQGQRAYVASGGSDTISVVDLTRLANWIEKADATTRREAIEDLTITAEYVVGRIPTERNPRQITLSPDGKMLFVSERLNDSVLVVDTGTLKPLGRLGLGDGGLDDPIRRGERVFTKAAYTFQRQFSCRSCHPDGHVDGLAYDFDGDGIGDNLLDNRSLQGVAGTAPFKWNGKNPTLEIQCGPRFARVLMRTDPIPPEELKNLTTFITSQPPPRWERRRHQELTPAQERGRQIFFATVTSEGNPIPRERQCHTCHRPPLYTNRLPSAIGTKGPRDVSDLFDTPHLLGIAYSAPYLHDGRAKTLEELWTTYQTNDLHGVSSYMNKHQLNDLVEFLKTL